MIINEIEKLCKKEKLNKEQTAFVLDWFNSLLYDFDVAPSSKDVKEFIKQKTWR